jgi:hypothetical protein
VPDSVGLTIAVAVGVLLIGWFWAGNEVMRRRAQRLAVWSKRALDPLGGQQSILWLGGQAFRLSVESPAEPFDSVLVTGLVESWDVPIVWAWNRLRGRRDMVLVQATLRRQPLLWGFEVYRPNSILAGDARHAARQEGWSESALDEFGLAAAAEHGTRLARDLVAELDAQRRRLVRLSARRTGHHLTLALNVPDADRFEPTELTRVVRRLAQRMAS